MCKDTPRMDMQGLFGGEGGGLKNVIDKLCVLAAKTQLVKPLESGQGGSGTISMHSKSIPKSRKASGRVSG
jgi:hypothetical protein